MTERLSALLHAEATDLDVPVPEAPTLLTRGRTLRRRRRVTTALTSVAVLAVIGGSVAVALGVTGDDRATDPLPAGGFGSSGAFSVGEKLYIGGQEIDWDEPIKTLYYTSAGVVVRSGDDVAAFCGDTLFAGSAGNARAGYDAILHSVRQKILALPPHATLYPGHGPATTVANELERNPFA
jgi:glyoxylase-like metal-dependent hydrolase (beta-lactamase superfamily II)